MVPGQDLHLPGGEQQWDVLVGEGGNQFNQELCFDDGEETQIEETDGQEVRISISSDSDKETRITLSLDEGSGQCGDKMDPAKRVVGMVIFGLGLGTVLFVVGYMIKNQLEVCADPRRNL